MLILAGLPSELYRCVMVAPDTIDRYLPEAQSLASIGDTLNWASSASVERMNRLLTLNSVYCIVVYLDAVERSLSTEPSPYAKRLSGLQGPMCALSPLPTRLLSQLLGVP